MGALRNSMIITVVGTVIRVACTTMTAYVLSKKFLPGHGAMMAVVMFFYLFNLGLIPDYIVEANIYGLKNTWWALWLPWVSGGQIMGMYLCRTFISGQSPALFEAARIDGCTEFKAFYKIAVPLAKPILATLVVMNMISFYGDFIWPLLVIDSNSKQVISVAVQTYSSSTGSTDYGAMIAGFAIATVPLLIMFMFSSRLYIEGITSGAVKA